MSVLTISVRNLKALVAPVRVCASTDAHSLPILATVHVKSHGPWLIAEATNRFRIGVHRQKCTDGDWPEFEAIVPLATLSGIFATFSAGRGSDPVLTLSAEDDSLVVESAGGFDGLFSEARIAYPLAVGEYPKFASIVRDAIAAEPVAGDRRFNWKYLSAFRAADPLGAGLIMHGGDPNKPLLVTDEENFIGVLMPRKLIGADRAAPTLDLSSWGTILSPAPVATKKPKRVRKVAVTA